MLWTDGEDLERGAREAIEEVGRSGVRVFAVGVGTPAGDVVPILDDRRARHRREARRERQHRAEPARRESAARARAPHRAAPTSRPSRPGGELPRLLVGDRHGVARRPRAAADRAAGGALPALRRARRALLAGRGADSLAPASREPGARRRRSIRSAAPRRAAVLLVLLASRPIARPRAHGPRGDRAFKAGRFAAAESLYALRMKRKAPAEVRVNRATAQALEGRCGGCGHRARAPGGTPGPRRVARPATTSGPCSGKGADRAGAGGAAQGARARPRRRGRALELRDPDASRRAAAAPLARSTAAPALARGRGRRRRTGSPAADAEPRQRGPAATAARRAAAEPGHERRHGSRPGRAIARRAPGDGADRAAAAPQGAGDARASEQGLVDGEIRAWLVLACDRRRGDGGSRRGERERGGRGPGAARAASPHGGRDHHARGRGARGDHRDSRARVRRAGGARGARHRTVAELLLDQRPHDDRDRLPVRARPERAGELSSGADPGAGGRSGLSEREPDPLRGSRSRAARRQRRGRRLAGGRCHPARALRRPGGHHARASHPARGAGRGSALRAAAHHRILGRARERSRVVLRRSGSLAGARHRDPHPPLSARHRRGHGGNGGGHSGARHPAPEPGSAPVAGRAPAAPRADGEERPGQGAGAALAGRRAGRVQRSGGTIQRRPGAPTAPAPPRTCRSPSVSTCAVSATCR